MSQYAGYRYIGCISGIVIKEPGCIRCTGHELPAKWSRYDLYTDQDVTLIFSSRKTWFQTSVKVVKSNPDP